MSQILIFICYDRKDLVNVKSLYTYLFDHGFMPWMDIEDILPGEAWATSIDAAISRCDFFMVCLSSNSVDMRGALQIEIKKALDIWAGKLPSDIYIIPVKLDTCSIPAQLSNFHFADLSSSGGYDKLVRSINEGISRRGIDLPASSVGFSTESHSKSFSLFEQHSVSDFVNKVLVTLASRYGWAEERIQVVNLVANELLNNGFEHACQGKGDLEVSIEFVIDFDGKKTFIRVKSPKGFNLQRQLRIAKNRDLLADRGRGLMLIERLSEKLIASTDGTIVQSVIGKESFNIYSRFLLSDFNDFEGNLFSFKFLTISGKKFFYIDIKSNTLDAHSSYFYRELFVDAAEAVVKDVYSGFIVSLSSVRFIDSSGLSVIVSAKKLAIQRGWDLYLCNLTSQVFSMVQLTRLHDVLDILVDLEEVYGHIIKVSSEC